MLRAGAIVLSVWAGINLLRATVVLAMVTLFNAYPPITRIVFSDPELAALSPKAVAAIKDLCILLMSVTAAFSLIVLVVAWTGLVGGQRWAFWTLLGTIGFVQALVFVGDRYIGNSGLPFNIVLTLVYLVGIVLSWYGLRR